MNALRFCLFALVIVCTGARPKRHAHRCFEEVDLEKCDYMLSIHGFDYFLNKEAVGYSDIICMIKWLRDNAYDTTPQLIFPGEP